MYQNKEEVKHQNFVCAVLLSKKTINKSNVQGTIDELNHIIDMLYSIIIITAE
jgi:hypothetical protein